MDRAMVYTGELPQTTDILSTNKFAMFGLAYAMQAVLGTTTICDGLACLPTSPTADLNVHIQVGSIYALTEVDATAYSDLGTDTSSILKQGINPSIVTLAITPPGTAGQSQVYLVQAEYQDVDTGGAVEPYYNSSNANAPFSGPNNSGTSNNTIREGKCTIALKAGVAAATGSQTTPAPDAGFVGLWAITVANGQTQITSPNIVAYNNSAAFIPVKLPAVPAGVQSGQWLYGADTSVAANTITANVSPIPTSLTLGMVVHIKVANTNTGATVLNLNGLGAVNVHRGGGAVLSAGDLVANQVASFVYDGSFWQIANYLGTSGANTNNFNNVNMPYALDTSTSSNTITVSPTPAMPATISAGQVMIVKLANPITGATTVAVSGVTGSPFPVISFTGQPLTYGSGRAGEMLWLLFDGTSFQIINPPQPLQAATTIYVNSSTGSDSFDGSQATVSGTKGPLQHIQTAVNKAFNYGPSQFAITIQCADGTYAEAVATPSIPGPAIIINGNNASPGNVLVTGSNAADTFLVQGPNNLTVQNLKAQTGTGPSYAGLTAFGSFGSGANLTVSNVICGVCQRAGVAASFGGYTLANNVTFAGNCTYAFLSENSATLALDGPTITISAAITVSDFAAASEGANIQLPPPPLTPTFVNPGNVTGQKYACGLNGIISTVGQGVNYFPGTVAGALSTGGQYG